MGLPRVVADVMVSAPAVLHVTHKIRAAQRIFTEKGFQHIPVIQGGRLVGMLTDRDVDRFVAGRAHGADLEVALAMSADPVTVCPEMFIEDAAALLVRH